MDVLSMAWRDMLFAHWPFDPATVEQRLPDGLEAHRRDGSAWVGVVAHRMADIRPRGAPIGRSFVEVNLRTYVRRGDRTGVYFFSLDAGDRLAVAIARRLWGLSYFRAESSIRPVDEGFRVESRRTHPGVPPARFRAEYAPVGDPAPPDPESLAAFVTDRYRFFTGSRVGMLTARLRRQPLPVARATADVPVNTVFEAAGFDAPEGDPHLLFGAPGGIRVRAGVPSRVAEV
jgi:uncharacterized protein YqjF (DUF2071 family)